MATLVTTQHGRVEFRKDRPALLVSSTSWTPGAHSRRECLTPFPPDEDFSIVLEALSAVDLEVCKRGEGGGFWEKEVGPLVEAGAFPRVVVLITGRGPLKEMYERRLRQMSMRYIRISTVWLSADDYPLLLGSADLGVCLHTSSSGLDLPMKVRRGGGDVTARGCGYVWGVTAGVCVWLWVVGVRGRAVCDGRSINELVREKKNGRLFQTASELKNLIIVSRLCSIWWRRQELLQDFPNGKKLQAMQKHLSPSNVTTSASSLTSQLVRWNESWLRTAKPVFDRVIEKRVPSSA
jgi:beta-1,4-mannosyltransferase